ncbi:MAG: hypothetical protein IJQ81_07375 [Oscillibacter sp.]|nr:hypothetical protein [Oscillibacter sp.]
MRIIRRAAAFVAALLLTVCGLIPARADDADTFRSILIRNVDLFVDGGGYYTRRDYNPLFVRTAWDGMEQALSFDAAGRPVWDVSVLRPSFCSEACYMALLRALSDWDSGGAISPAAWRNLKPYAVEGLAWPYQHDGYGCWGRANANGPGFAALIARLGAGTNLYIGNPSEYASASAYWQRWDSVQKGDFVKLFWNRYIGADESHYESGHMVLFIGRAKSYVNGKRDDIITYWSSNGSGTNPNGGYGITSCRASKIYRAVRTRITNPAAFDRAREIDPLSRDSWLAALESSHLGTVAELKTAISGGVVEWNWPY